MLGDYFRVVQLSANIWWAKNGQWFLSYGIGKRSYIEAQAFFGQNERRKAYNHRMAARAAASRTLIIGTHLGMRDVFAPIVSADGVLGFLVVGPFLEAQLDAGEIRKRYRRLTGRAPSASDANYELYLRIILETPILTGARRERFLSYVTGMAEVLAGRGDPSQAFEKLRRNWLESEQECFDHVMWETAARFVDRLENPVLRASFGHGGALEVLRLRHRPTDVIALVPDGRPASTDPTEWLVNARIFQRRVARYAHDTPGMLAGRLGDDGAFLLLRIPPTLSEARRRAQIARTVREMRELGARSGFALRAGVGSRAERGDELPERYEEAVKAAGAGWPEPHAIAFHPRGGDASTGGNLNSLARELEAACRRSDPAELESVLERGVRAVLARAAGNLESARAHFESLARELAGALERSALLERRSSDTILRRLESELHSSQELLLLVAAFQRAARALVAAGVSPAKADREARLDMARALIDSDPSAGLDLPRMARRVGLSVTHFSESFRQHHGVGFKRYLVGARIAKAQSLLESTPLPVQRVATLAGFGSYAHFSRVFREKFGVSPRAHRQNAF
jgi:AraC-like DNA-binding protein